MARTVKDANLQTRAAREKLDPRKKPYWRTISPNRHLGYYKGERGGTWIARRYVGDGRYEEQRLAVADDIFDADGVEVLTFGQAQERAREWFAQQAAPKAGPMTVAQAIEGYIEYLQAEKKTATDTEGRLKLHVTKPLAARAIAELNAKELERWRNGMVKRDTADPEVERRSKDTANRVLTMLRAALNKAFRDDANKIPTDKAWRTVKPFRDVGRARQEHLDPQQSKRLINACSGRLRDLVTAALLTGARPPGELAGVRVKHFNAGLRSLHIPEGKTGPRDVVLTTEATRWFEGIAAGRNPDDLLLPREDGTAWGDNHHVRLMHEAVRRAGLSEETTIYSCRHTYASQSLLAGMNLQVLAENMGTSVRMIEQHYGKFLAASRQKLIEQAAPKFGLEPPKITPMRGRKVNNPN